MESENRKANMKSYWELHKDEINKRRRVKRQGTCEILDLRIKYGELRKQNMRIYHIWESMKSRCYDSKNKCYYLYGGRGIAVCDEWKNDFLKFCDWALNNGYADNLTIDRIDNYKGYFPDNCRWATNLEQQRNKRNSKGHIGTAIPNVAQ